MPTTVRARIAIVATLTMLVTAVAGTTAAPAGAVMPTRAAAESAHLLVTTTYPACPSKATFLRLERRQGNPNAHSVTQRECVRRWAAISVTDGHGNGYPTLFRYTDAHRWKWRDRFNKEVCRNVPRPIHWVCVGG
jgi:hypothetical protein